MKKLFAFFVVLVIAVGIATPTFAQNGPVELTAWRHIGDVQEEMDYFGSLVDDFNASQNEWEVIWEELPQGTYEDSINAAALAGNLPCLMDVDGPFIPNFAWAGHIVPLDGYISDELRADILSSALGQYNGQTYGVGLFDAVIGVWGRRSIMEKYDLRIATADEPWTKEEFDAMLETLAASDEFEVAIEMYNFYTHEWWPYAYSPLLQSFGGDLIDRNTYLSAEGVLNGPEAIAWGEWFQNIFQGGLADPNPPDDQGFIQGRAGLAYIGNWQYPNMYAAWGDDLIVMPPPDLGNGPVVGGASWQWAITSNCENPDGAWAFIEYLASPEATAGYSDVTGLIPARISAAPMTANYSEEGPLGVMVQFANNWVVIRPPTPAYAVISNEFFNAAQAITNGANVQDALDDAVDAIEQDIADNDGYGFGE
jgi:multiple sugar transport system substrate-binding protein